MPIEHNRDRPSRESVKEPQRSSLRRPGDYFPFVKERRYLGCPSNNREVENNTEIFKRPKVLTHRLTQFKCKLLNTERKKWRLALELNLHLVFYERALWKAGSTPEWLDTYALVYDYAWHSDKSTIYCCRGIWEINRCPLDGLKIKAWRQILLQRLNLFLVGWKPRLFSRRFH